MHITSDVKEDETPDEEGWQAKQSNASIDMSMNG